MPRLSALLLSACLIGLPVFAQSPVPGRNSVCPEATLKNKQLCHDGVLFDIEGTVIVQSLYGRSDFEALDELYEKWSKGEDRFPDGRWKLVMFEDSLEDRFRAWRTWAEDRKKIAEWQAKFPDSFAAKHMEAMYWRAYAWSARGNGYASTVAPEAWTLFKERMGFADKALESLRARADKHPAWHVTAITTKLEMGNRAAAADTFRLGVEVAPEYHSIYFAMGRAFEPKWGGSAENFDRFARESVKLAKFEAEGMYTRLYWTVDSHDGVPFDSANDSIPDWGKLKAGIQLLAKKYPSSAHNLSHFASMACRAHDKDLYQELRTRLGSFVRASHFSGATLEACDLRFGLSNKS